MARVARWSDYQGRSVELTDEAWTHIVQRHADMVARLDAVRTAIESPALVVRDPNTRRIEHHYGAARGRLRVHVAVIYRPTPEGWIGTIRTAYRTDRTIQGEQLWP
jgi:hypothetical protein